MRIIGLIFALIVLSSHTVISDHPLKMSFSNLTISSVGNVELETHIFLDDLTAHIRKLYGLQQVDFSSNTSNGTQALQGYFRDHLYFEQEGKKFPLDIHTVGFSKNQIALLVHMNTLEPLDPSKEVFLVNSILCDAFPRQINSVRYRDDSHQLTIGSPKLKIRIK